MKILKKVKPIRIIFLIVLLAGNTFAWFIYTTKVDSSISVHVKSWNVIFRAGEDEITSEVSINVGNVFPGMEEYNNEVTAYNKSDLPATLSYRLLEANILGEEYITPEGRSEREEEAEEGDLTSSELVNKLATEYPFKILFTVSNPIVSANNGEEKYNFRVVWPFDQSDDELDTYWGIKAAEYKNSNPSEPSITLKVKLIITQNPS